MHKAT